MSKFKKSRISKTLSLVLVLIFILGAFAGCGSEKEEEITTTTPPATETTKPQETIIRNPLTGDAAYSKELVNNRPVFVVVENHPDARPQWGLTSSDIVWEMVAEGGITRMLLMFADSSRLPEKIGPIRSARHYFVDLAEGFDGIFVHFGFSPYAKNQIADHGVNNINGLYDNYFFRDKSRGVASEHTAYTTNEEIAKAIENKGYRTEIKEDYKAPFKFNDEAKQFENPCSSIVVSYSSGYTYTYTYDKENNVYLSSLNGKNFVDSEGTQQNFENIILCYTTISSMGDSKGRVNFDLSSGKGIYVSNGSYTEITWEKGNSADMLKFYTTDGEELSLNVGRTYIGILDKSRESANTIA